MRKPNPIVTELFIRNRKLKNYLVFITQSVPKNIRLNSAYTFIMEFPTKRQVKQIPFSNSSDIGFKDFTTLYKTYTTKAYSILVNDTTLV